MLSCSTINSRSEKLLTMFPVKSEISEQFDCAINLKK